METPQWTRWAGWLLIGDGTAGLVMPRRYLRALEVGPQPIQNFFEMFAQRPKLTRAVCIGEIDSAPGWLRGDHARNLLSEPLRNTGQQVSCIGLGGSHIGSPKVQENEAVRLMREAIDRGLTFMDSSWDYHKGQSEIRLGKGAPGRLSSESLRHDEVRRADEGRGRETDR